MGNIEHYEWLTVEPDGTYGIDMMGTTPAEMDRRMVIAQELQAGRVVLAQQHAGAAATIERLADLTDGLPFEETDTPVQLIEKAIRLAHQLHGGRSDGP